MLIAGTATSIRTQTSIAADREAVRRKTLPRGVNARSRHPAYPEGCERSVRVRHMMAIVTDCFETSSHSRQPNRGSWGASTATATSNCSASPWRSQAAYRHHHCHVPEPTAAATNTRVWKSGTLGRKTYCPLQVAL
jgi:hypothetical protein